MATTWQWSTLLQRLVPLPSPSTLSNIIKLMAKNRIMMTCYIASTKEPQVIALTVDVGITRDNNQDIAMWIHAYQLVSRLLRAALNGRDFCVVAIMWLFYLSGLLKYSDLILFNSMWVPMHSHVFWDFHVCPVNFFLTCSVKILIHLLGAWKGLSVCSQVGFLLQINHQLFIVVLDSHY